MRILLRGLALGAGFGVAASAVEIWLALLPVTRLRMGPGARVLLENAGGEIALCAALGVLAAPLLRLRAGRPLHVLALAAAWAGLARWVELDTPLFARLQYVPPLAGALLALLGLRLARVRPALPIALGLALLAGGAAAPGVYLARTTPPRAERPALPPARAGAPDVVLVVLDTVRAQDVSAYGYARATTPTLDGLAREGALFLDATSPSTWSLESHASLFTGRYPSSHGAHGEHRFLDDRFPTLAAVLASRGYETLCFTANAWISDGLGLTRGFARQDLSWRDEGGGAGHLFGFLPRVLAKLGVEPPDKGGGTVVRHFARWVDERPTDGPPSFVFLNFIEAHFPYHQLPDAYLSAFTDRPRRALRQLSLDLLAAQFGGRLDDPARYREAALDMYDGGVLYTDHLLAQVVDALRRKGALERTILVVLADHGEVLGEHGDFFGHGPSLHEPMIRVPLVIRGPGVPAGVRVPAPVSTVGVFATILDLAGVEPPPTLQVGSLVPVVRGEPGGGPVLSERHDMRGMMPPGVKPPSDPLMRADARFRAYRQQRWKLVESSHGDAYLFDVEADPGEARDLAAERPAELARLRADLEGVRLELGLPALDAERAAGPSPELDAETTERLRQLGYVE